MDRDPDSVTAEELDALIRDRLEAEPEITARRARIALARLLAARGHDRPGGDAAGGPARSPGPDPLKGDDEC